MLLPFIRINRALASTLILPNEPIKAIAISEITSVFLPLLNKNNYNYIIGYVLAFMYAPNYASAIIYIYKNKELIYHQSEICFLLLFILTIGINYI